MIETWLTPLTEWLGLGLTNLLLLVLVIITLIKSN